MASARKRFINNVSRIDLDPVWWALIALLFVMSLNSLTSFPFPYDDEGYYAAYGHGYYLTGVFSSPSMIHIGPFANGNAWHARLGSWIFGALGYWNGYTLATARIVSFSLIWSSALLWFWISRALGISGALGVLLFVSNERIFYASHAFRPESSLVLANTTLLFFIVREGSIKSGAAVGRGLINGLMVLAHGNGLVSAVLNTLDILVKKIRTSKIEFLPIALYFIASLAGVFAFYWIHFHSVGGIGVANAQVDYYPQYHFKRTLLESVLADLRLRWGTELIEVGGSWVAKLLRISFYSIVVVTALFSLTKTQGPARRYGAWALGTILGYIFLVSDKIDIHIAEMIPFFLISLIAFSAQKTKNRPRGFLAPVYTALAIGLFLSFHHAIKYRNEDHPTQWATDAVVNYLSTQTKRPPGSYTQVVAPMNFWFSFKNGTQGPGYQISSFIGSRYFDTFPEPHGGVIGIYNGQSLTYWAKCTVDYSDPKGKFTAYFCP